jgi:hypothetical protein
MTWSGRGALVLTAASTWRAHKSDDLVLRLAADASANDEGVPQRPGTNAVPFRLVLTDRWGVRSAVDVTSRYGAPEPPPGSYNRVLLLSDVRIPLRVFRRVRLSALRSVTLELGTLRREGELQLADVSLQRR